MGIFRTIFGMQTDTQQLKERSLFNEQAYQSSIIPRFSQTLGPVRESEALSLSAFTRGLNLKADILSDMPLQRFRDHEKLSPGLLLEQPCPYETRKDTLFAWVIDLELYGNCFGILNFAENSGGYPTSITPVAADQVTVRVNVKGEYEYRIGETYYSPSAIFHVRGFRRPGELLGRGVLNLNARTLRHANEAQNRSYKALTTGAVPPAALVYNNKTNEALDNDERRLLKENYLSVLAANEPLVLDYGMTIQEFGFNSQEQQLLEARQFSIIEIANALNLPSHYLNFVLSSSDVYQNVESQNLTLINYSLRGLFTRFEAAFTNLIPRGQYARFNLDALLRADSETRMKVQTGYVNAGIKTANEAREQEDMKPLTEQPTTPLGDLPL